MPLDPTARFTDRVDNYVRYRPTYPPQLISELVTRAQLSPARSIIADIGSGTGILTGHLLPHAARVHAVEPNAAMRVAAERTLGANPRFASIDATAESTTLPPRSIDLVTAGQSFHWFNHAGARREFTRILKPGGFVALVWNERQTSGTPFLEDYEATLRHLAPDYARSRHALVNESIIAEFFAPDKYQLVEFLKTQSLDLEAFIGRSLSSSYAPNKNHPNHTQFIAALRSIFEGNAQNERVEMHYQSRMYFGRLTC
ncbi:class I SAM-dependent methyltransferase [Ereboglobus luteus]|uniref:SAM-dependent methyltransferase n=1 Tax=Ereboglobus luteus TaxID=1796921 RepID=A0A2U8E3U3_9BACT|nr:class I SAM-dependent methyltransferase [Ereboglobus luteus]AWI09569.1 SAM-dependent methyltransferase [Ereboglobus luteus]